MDGGRDRTNRQIEAWPKGEDTHIHAQPSKHTHTVALPSKVLAEESAGN